MNKPKTMRETNKLKFTDDEPVCFSNKVGSDQTNKSQKILIFKNWHFCQKCLFLRA